MVQQRSVVWPEPMGRRRAFGWTAGLAALAGGALWSGPAPLRAAGLAPRSERFAALQRPAQLLRQPDRAVLLAGCPAGRRVVVVGERGVALWSDDGGRRWQQAEVPVSVTLTAVAFADERRGWAVGHGGVVLASVDGGQRWEKRIDGRELAALALQAARAEAGEHASGADPQAHPQVKAAELLVADGPDKPLLALCVLGPDHIVVIGAYNLAFESQYGGRRWVPMMARWPNPKALHLYALAVQADTWLVAGEQGLMLRSQDGGKRFERVALPYAGSWFTLVAPRPGQWLVAGLRGHAYASRDDGANWQALDGAPPAGFVGALSLGDGRVLLTNQAGQLLLADPGRSNALSLLPGPALPPPAQVLRSPDGALLALGLAGVQRMPFPIP